jgi:RND family efflux transporter MFP subunit
MRWHRGPRAHLSAFLLLVAFGFACGSNEYAEPPPPAVTVQRPSVRDVTRFAEHTGTTRAVESVEVRARVKGFLESMHFRAGDDVVAGALLFTIDPEPFEVALEAAEAAFASAEAERDLAQTEFDRTQMMFDQEAMSELKLIQARAKRDKAVAAVAAATAEVHAAKLDLEYAHVKAPITGRVGRHLIDMGNLVGAQEATLLAEMVRYAPIYVYFHLSERDLLALQELSRSRREERGADYEDRQPTPVQVGRANEEGYPHEGKIDFSALEIDPDTGTFEIRGLLPNEGALDEIIVPGTFVRVRVPIGEQKDALLLSERALGADQNGRYVLVVNDADVVEQRPVEVGPLVDGLRVIETGLRAEDWVIVNGLQRARPGAPVAAERAEGGAATDGKASEAPAALGSAAAAGGE